MSNAEYDECEFCGKCMLHEQTYKLWYKFKKGFALACLPCFDNILAAPETVVDTFLDSSRIFQTNEVEK